MTELREAKVELTERLNWNTKHPEIAIDRETKAVAFALSTLTDLEEGRLVRPMGREEIIHILKDHGAFRNDYTEGATDTLADALITAIKKG